MSWKKYRSKVTTQPKHNNLYYMIDPTFRNINRLFAVSTKNGGNDPTKIFAINITSHQYKSKILMHLLTIKQFFDQPKNINKKRMKNLLKYQ